jgi:hypothetical protein
VNCSPATSPGAFTEVIDNDFNEIAWYADTTSGTRTVSGGTIDNSQHAQMVMAFVPAATSTDATVTFSQSVVIHP